MRIKLPPMSVCAFDPGETVGCAEIFDYKHESDQFNYEYFLSKKIQEYTWADVWIVESYRIYKNKANVQIMNDMLTPQIIGAIKSKARDYNIEVVEQSASAAKGLCKNDLLREYKMYYAGKDHANDASRHLLYYLLTHRS